MKEVPFGRRVVVPNVVYIQREFNLPDIIIPAGSVGMVDTGTVGMSCFLFAQECPVVFDNWIELRLPPTLGVPWEHLELA